MQKTIRTQLSDLRPVFLWVYGPLCMGMVIILGAIYAAGIPLAWLTRDPLAIMGGEFYVGSISNFGILFWCGAATISLFTAGLLGRSEEAREDRKFLLFGGLLTLLLCLDDLYMFHETVFPRYFHLKEGLVVLSYGVLLMAYVWRFRKTILESRFLLLLLASLFLGVSAVVDRLVHDTFPLRHLIEDGSKLFGIVSWFAYYLTFCRNLLAAKTGASGE